MNKKDTLLKLNDILLQGSFVQNKEFLLDSIGDFDTRLYFVNKLPKQIENLEELDFLWSYLIKDARPFGVLDIFEASINENNSKYIIDFISTHYSEIGAKFNDGLFKEEALRVVIKTLKTFPNLHDDVFDFLKGVLKFYSSAFKRLDSRQSIEQEKILVAELLKTIFDSLTEKEIKGRERIIKTIWKHFNLIGDEGEFSFYTPPQVFGVIKEFVDFNFIENFPIVVKSIIKQYQGIEWYKNKFSGWELMGSGISQSGDIFTIGDHHYIKYVLIPALTTYYQSEPKTGWQYILDNVITSEETNVSATRPDFLNRTAIPLLVDEYASGNNSEEALSVLKSFISMKRGIPHKSELIFQEVYNKQDLDDSKKWNLVKIQLETPMYNGLPANVFVERIASDLAQKGNKDAAKVVGSWSKNPDYRKRQQTGAFTVLENTMKLLSNDDTFAEGLDSLKDYLTSDEFIKELESFNAWDVSKAIARVLSKDTTEGISLLKALFNLPTLTTNQQIVLCGSLSEIPDANGELLLNVFNGFVKPNFEKLNNAQMESKIPSTSARETLLKFNENLAKSKNYSEAMWMVKKFVDDSDPNRDGSNDKDDVKGDFNKHRQIVEGNDLFSIDTVRGWVAWVLQQFAVTGGEKYITEVIPMVKKLSVDGNYYIRLQACIPLMGLVRNRHTVLAESGKRFMSLKNAIEVENIAFAMLEDKDNQRLYAIMKHLAMVFSYMRSLGTVRAEKALEIFKNTKIVASKDSRSKNDRRPTKSDDPTSGVINEASSLFIYYAEFRKKAFKSDKNKALYGDELWKEISSFDDKPFKKMLATLLEDGRSAVKASFAWHFWRLPQEKGIDFNESFAISYKYFLILLKTYDHPVFEDIYHFIDDNIETKFQECFDLWTACLQKERPYLQTNTNSDNWRDMYWWPYFYNGKILALVFDKLGKDVFLKWFDYLVDYPKDMLIANDIDVAVSKLISLPNTDIQAEKILEKLINRNSKYIDSLEKWKTGQ